MDILKISKQFNKNQQITDSPKAYVQKGFMLLELMVAVMILLFCMVLMYRYQGMCIETNYETIKRYEATNLVHSFLAQASRNSSLLKQKDYSKGECTLTWTFEDFPFKEYEGVSVMSSKARLIKIKATWYGWNKKKHSFFITSGIVL